MENSTILLHVERARAGEGDALGELFDEFRPDILRLCTRLLGQTDAEDALSETFQRGHSQLDDYDTTRPFRAWLMAIASHHCIDRLRRRSVEKRIFSPSDTEIEDRHAQTGSAIDATDALNALDALVQHRRQSAVRAAIDRLPDRYRAPLVLRYFAELDYDAIGQELDLTHSQVASLLFRSKKQLRTLLRTDEEAAI